MRPIIVFITMFYSLCAFSYWSIKIDNDEIILTDDKGMEEKNISGMKCTFFQIAKGKNSSAMYQCTKGNSFYSETAKCKMQADGYKPIPQPVRFDCHYR